MIRRWWAKLLLAVALFVFLAVVLVVGFLHTEPGRKRVLSWLQDYLFANQGIRLETQEIQYNLFDLAVSLREVRLSSRAAPDLPPILTADRMYIDLSTMSMLLHGFLAIEQARIDSPVVRIVILKDGRNNIPVSRQKVEEKSGGLPSFLIESARIGKGSFSFTDEREGIRARLGNWQTSINGAWSTMNHEVKLTGEGEVEQAGRKLPISALDLQAALPSNLKNVTLHNLDVRTPDANVHVTGTVDDLGNPNLGLKVTADADLARVSALADVTPPVGGRVHLDGDVRNTLDALQASGQVTGQNVSFRSLDHVNLSSRVLWDMAQKRLKLSDLAVRSPDADLRGQASVSTEPTGQNNASLDVSRLDLEGLMKGLDVGVRVASQAKGRVDASWIADNLDAANVNANLQLNRTSGQPRRNTIPLSGSVMVKKEGGQAQVRLNKAESMDASVDADIRVSSLSNLQTNPNGQVTGQVSARVVDLLRLTTGLARFLGKPGPLLGTEVAGPAQLNARLGGTLQQPLVNAEVRAPSTKVGNLQGVSLDLGTNYAGDRLTINRGLVSWSDERLVLGGTVSRLRSSDPALDLNARLDNGSIHSIFLAAGQTAPVTGRFKLLAGVTGTVNRPLVTGNFNASELQAYGEALGTLAAEASLQNRDLVTRLSLQKPSNQGKLDVNARYNLDNQSYDFKARCPSFRTDLAQAGRPNTCWSSQSDRIGHRNGGRPEGHAAAERSEPALR